MELCVATTGHDTWEGTSERPFATLTRARDAARQAGGGATVTVRGGVYPLAETLALTAEDAGLVIRAYPGEPVRLIGGQAVTGFAPVTDPAVLARLAPDARAHVVQVELAAQGLTDCGGLSARGWNRKPISAHLQVFVNGEAQTLARWPNDGFAAIAGIPDGAGQDDSHGQVIGALDAGFHYDGDRPARWQDTGDIWVHGYWAWDWANTYERVASFDHAARRVWLNAPGEGCYGFRAGARHYYLNILEELDTPGEYFVDRDRGILYLWPTAPLEGAEVVVSVLETPLVTLEGAEDVTLQGLTLEMTRGHGVVIAGGARCRLQGCTLRHLGNWGVRVAGGEAHAISRCTIADTGDGGISLEGGDRISLTPGAHLVEHCEITRVGAWTRCYQPGVIAHGVGHRIAHNHIHHGPHCAVLIHGNEHLIEYNDIHHMCLETGDVGAFYIGRDYTEQGNVVRYNYFHELGSAGHGGSMAVYLDDCASGVLVFGNLFYRTERAAFVGGGRDNHIINNVFVQCNPSVMIDGRGLDASPVWHNMVYETMQGRLAAMLAAAPHYRERYPALAALDAYFAGAAGVPPEGNVVARNISVESAWLTIHWYATPAMVEIHDNLVDVDPHFLDAAQGDFRLRDDSPAFALGFEPIPVERIGILPLEEPVEMG